MSEPQKQKLLPLNVVVWTDLHNNSYIHYCTPSTTHVGGFRLCVALDFTVERHSQQKPLPISDMNSSIIFTGMTSKDFRVKLHANEQLPGSQSSATMTKLIGSNRFNRVFQDANIHYKDPPRILHDRKKKIEKPRTNVVEIESRNIANAFQRAMKTLQQGCKRDPMPWWDEELDEAIYERSRLKKIRDMPAADEIKQMRQL